MKKITRKNKIRVNGTWDSLGMEIYWQPKTDYIFSFMPDKLVKLGNNEVEVLGKFGCLANPLKIKTKKVNGFFDLGEITAFDLAIMKIKLDQLGLKDYRFNEVEISSQEHRTYLSFKDGGDDAVFLTYFSEFIEN